MLDKDSDMLAKMKNRLYKRDEKLPQIERARFSFEKEDTKTDWVNNEDNMKKRKILSPITMLLVVAAIFFVIAVGYAAYSFTSGRNIISADNIDISVTGPVAAKGGEEVTLQIAITNHNSVSLESTDLAVIFPAGTRDPLKLSEDLTRYPHYIGTLNPGDTIRETVKAVMFGDENEEKKIGVQLQYRTEGSNAIFEKNKDYIVTISSAPVHVSLAVPSEANAGQEIPVEITVNSNSSQTLQAMYLELVYPDGFTFRSADPKPILGSNMWSLGDIPPGGSRTIKITGVISGNANSTKGFKAITGLRQLETDRSVSIPYASVFEPLAIKNSFIGFNFVVDGDSSPEITAVAGNDVRADITWTNQLSVPVRNAEITVAFSGNTLDPSTVSTQSGFYRSTDNTIIWKSQGEPSLGELPSGGVGHVNFNFSSLSNQMLVSRGLANPELHMVLTFKGERVSEGFGTEQITATEEKVMRFNTQLGMMASAVYSVGAFTNSGPMPPRVNFETTYSVVLTATNSTNDSRDLIATAILPTYVKWLGNISPSDENISYNDGNGKITWEIGKLRAKFSKEVVFQISITPGLGQVDEKQELVSVVEVSGRDEFTGETISAKSSVVNTEIQSDPNYIDAWARVTN